MHKAAKINRVYKVVMVGGSTLLKVMVESILNASTDFALVETVSEMADVAATVDDLRPDLVLIAHAAPRIDAGVVLDALGEHRLLRKAVLSAEPLAGPALHRLMSAGAAVFEKSVVAEDHDGFRAELRTLMSRPGQEPRPRDTSLILVAQDEPATVAAPERAAASDASAARMVGEAHATPAFDDETLRLTALHALGIANGSSDRRLDLIVKHLCQVTGYPMAAVTLIDESVQWIKAGWGIERGSTPRMQAICNHTIRCPSPLIVADTFTHPVFSTFDLVTQAQIRSYVGVPLIVETGYAIGALCLADRRPRTSVQTELPILTDMAALIVEIFDKPWSRMAA